MNAGYRLNRYIYSPPSRRAELIRFQPLSKRDAAHALNTNLVSINRVMRVQSLRFHLIHLVYLAKEVMKGGYT